MSHHAITPAPLLRPLVFALASVLFAVAAHTSTEGALPAWWCVGLAIPAVLAACAPLARLEQRFGGLLAGLVAIQLALHAFFVVAANQRPGAAGWLCCGSSQPVTVTAHSAALLSLSAVVQLTAHLVAAVALALLLRRQERAVWARVRSAVSVVLAAVVTVVRAVFALLPPAPRPSPLPRPHATAPRGRADLVIARRIARRGPPLLAAV